MNCSLKTRILVILCAALVGCNRQAPTHSASGPASLPAPPPPLVLTDDIRARLAYADAADGKPDHIIEKCVTCRLHMPGNPKFTVTVGDYHVQLCSVECKTAFENDPVKALVALSKP